MADPAFSLAYKMSTRRTRPSFLKGKIQIHLMETIVTKRLDYLNDILKGKEAVYNEYLIDGSVYDNVGHFILCLLSILWNNHEFSTFLIQAETELFKRRLKSLTAYEIRCFSKKLLKSVRKLENCIAYINAIQTLCQHLTLKNYAHHITYSHNEYCSMYKIKMCFKYCLPFIAKRQVELANGMAFMPCSKWLSFLMFLYKNHLIHRLRKTNLHSLNNDERIFDLLNVVKSSIFNPPYYNKKHILLSKDVNIVSKYFPPCMLNLHKNLRQKHRLTHIQRFYYSLFLKDIGMPVEEAIQFWKVEYEKAPNGFHKCCHTWERDSKKFIYGIRHLYGIEGGKKLYTSVNCQKIQSTDCASSEGGCPFKTFDNSKMLNILDIEDNHELFTQINDLQQRQQYIPACQLYLQTKYTDSNIEHGLNFTPLKFFTIASQSKI